MALSTLSEDVLERELKPLQMLNDNYPKYLLVNLGRWQMPADCLSLAKICCMECQVVVRW